MSIENKYKKYLFDHINNVTKGFSWIMQHFPELGMQVDIEQLQNHDNSKFDDEEFIPYAEYFYGEKTDEVEEDFNYAWNHHQKNNPHHWQYWVLINDEDGTKCLDMPLNYMVEMICDWWAFSWNKGNLYEIFDWYKKNKKKMMLSDTTRVFVEDTLYRIKEVLDNE
jgi:hypothetical protein